MRYLPLTLGVLALATTGVSSSGWTRLPPPPHAAPSAVSVWTGKTLFYWGGTAETTSRSVGALYRPSTHTWRKLPPAPVPGRSRAAVVWTGKEVLVWGGESGLRDGALFDPARRTWRRMRMAPTQRLEPAAYVWTGAQLIVCCSAAPRSPTGEGAAFRLSRNRWRRIRDAPLALSRAHAAWTGREMIVVGKPPTETLRARAMAYDPTRDRWRVLPTPPLSPNASSIVWAGRRLIGWDYELRAASYDPARNRWRALPSLPLDAVECNSASAVIGPRVFAAYCSQAAMLDLRTNRWDIVADVPRALYGPPVTGGRNVYFAGLWAGRNTFWSYRP